MTLPADTARCPGVGSDAEGWRDGCETCLRRTAPQIDHPSVPYMTPPQIIVFWCEFYVEPQSTAKIQKEKANANIQA